MLGYKFAGWTCMATVVAILIAVAQPCHAQDLKSQLQQCGTITDNISRLQCFDNITKRVGMSSSTDNANGSGQQGSWATSESNNPLDDTKTVVLTDSSTSGVDQQGNPIDLVVRCQSGQTSVYLIWGDFLGDDNIDTSLRIGSSPVSQESWSTSTDHTASFSPTPIPLARELIGVDKLVVQVVPYDENPIIATFDTTGLTQAITPLAQTCDWKP